MEISINGLTERSEEFLSQLANARHRHLAGLAPRQRLTKQVADFSSLLREDTFLQVRQTADSPKTDVETKASLQRLLRFLAWGHGVAAAAADLDECAEELDRPINSSMQTMPLAEAIARLPEDFERERRHALERDLSEALWERQTSWARVIDSHIHSSAHLGFSSMRAHLETLSGIELQPWLDAAEKLLATTEDAYRDLLGYVLKRIDPQLKPQTAHWHDVLHATTVPWMRELFRAEELLPAVTRTFEDLSLPLGRLRLDTEARDDKATGAHVSAVRVPGEVYVTVNRRGGMHACAELLATLAEAQLWAHGSAGAGILERRFPETATIEGVRLLVSNFCLEEGWLKRTLRMPSAAAREAARIGAFSALASLRQAAAMLPYALEVFARGPVRPLAEEYEDRMTRALGVAVPRGGFLLNVEGVDPLALRAATLAVGLGDGLRERFNEDYFRNPATGSWFVELAARAGVDTHRPVAANLFPREPTPRAADGNLTARTDYFFALSDRTILSFAALRAVGALATDSPRFAFIALNSCISMSSSSSPSSALVPAAFCSGVSDSTFEP